MGCDRFWCRRRFIATEMLGVGSAVILAACRASGSDRASSTERAVPGTAAGGGQSRTAPRKGGVLILAKEQDDPPKLDPTALLSLALFEVNALYMEGLLTFDASSVTETTRNTVLPVLATSWEQPDRETVLFKLEAKAAWHDLPPVNGRPFRSSDAKATLDRINDPSSMSPLGGLLRDFVDRYETTDNQTLSVKLKRPFGALFEVLAAGFISMMPEEGAKGGYDLEKIHIGTGAFILKEVKPGVRYVYEKNHKYRQFVYLDGIEQVVIKDQNALTSGILSKKLHLATLPRGFDLTVIPESSYNIYRSPGITRHELAILRKHKPFNDIRVRQAFKYAIDQLEIVQKSYNGDATTTGIIPYSSPWALPKHTNDRMFETNIEKARSLLVAAGVETYTGQIEHSTVYGSAVSSVSEVLAAQLAKIGVKLAIKGEEHTTFLRKQYACDYVLNSRMVSGNTGNGLYDWCYKNEHTNGLYSIHNCASLPPDNKLNDMALRAVGAFDPKEQQAINEEFQRYLADVVYFVPLAVPNQNRIVHKSVQGFGFHTSSAVGVRNPFVAGYWLTGN